jgi:prophage regulatory protein
VNGIPTKPLTPDRASSRHQVALDEQRIKAILDQIPARAFIRTRLLLYILPFPRMTVMKKVTSGNFPQSVKLTRRITAWRVEDVRNWMKEDGLLS